MRDQISHPYNTTTGKIIVLYILSLNIWIAGWKAKDVTRNGSKHVMTSGIKIRVVSQGTLYDVAFHYGNSRL
jgi:hypothetical protein